MKRIDAKPGERKYIDGRFKDGVDTGRFSSNKIPLPLKPTSPVSTKVAEMLDSIPDWVNDIPKQVIRQQEASRHFKNKKKINTHEKEHENVFKRRINNNDRNG